MEGHDHMGAPDMARHHMGGPDMAPHTPQRSEHPGKPGALLDPALQGR